MLAFGDCPPVGAMRGFSDDGWTLSEAYNGRHRRRVLPSERKPGDAAEVARNYRREQSGRTEGRAVGAGAARGQRSSVSQRALSAAGQPYWVLPAGGGSYPRVPAFQREIWPSVC